MTYEDHKEGICDKCEKKPAKHKVPFIYLDKQDKAHEDVSELVGHSKGTGYRQYYVCDNCFKEIKR